MRDRKGSDKAPKWLVAALIISLCFGVFFRLYNLGGKAFWFDEVVTAHILSGTPGWVVRQEIDCHAVGVDRFIDYLRITEDKSLSDAIDILFREDTGQPLPYYGLLWLWEKAWNPGSREIPATLRSFSAVISLMNLPLMWWLACLLFDSKRVAMIALILLAVSPMNVLYAQEARVYSLLTMMSMLSSCLLLKAVEFKKPYVWAAYCLSACLGLYLHMLFGFIILAHGAYLYVAGGIRWNKNGKAYFISAISAVLIYLPGLAFVLGNLNVFRETVSWMSYGADPLTMVAGFGSGLVNVFFDIDFGAYPLILVVPIAFFVALCIGYWFFWSLKNAPTKPRLFISTQVAGNLLPLIIPDLLLGGMRSAVPRYMLYTYILIVLSAAYFFSKNVDEGRWRKTFAIVVLAGMMSCALSSQSTVWWNKYPTLHYPQMAKEVNNAERPLLVSDQPLPTLWSFGLLLEPKASIYLVTDTSNVELPEGYDAYALNPSPALTANLEAKYTLNPVDNKGGLWLLLPRNP